MSLATRFLSKFATGTVAGAQSPTVNDRGNTVHRLHLGDGDRYFWDFDDDFRAAEWEQFDTDQDASFFGVWVNRRLMQTLTYCEGDLILVTCPDARHYNDEITDACRYYGEGFEAITCDSIGPGLIPLGDVQVFRQDRTRFLAEVAQ